MDLTITIRLKPDADPLAISQVIQWAKNLDIGSVAPDIVRPKTQVPPVEGIVSLPQLAAPEQPPGAVPASAPLPETDEAPRRRRGRKSTAEKAAEAAAAQPAAVSATAVTPTMAPALTPAEVYGQPPLYTAVPPGYTPQGTTPLVQQQPHAAPMQPQAPAMPVAALPPMMPAGTAPTLDQFRQAIAAVNARAPAQYYNILAKHGFYDLTQVPEDRRLGILTEINAYIDQVVAAQSGA